MPNCVAAGELVEEDHADQDDGGEDGGEAGDLAPLGRRAQDADTERDAIEVGDGRDRRRARAVGTITPARPASMCSSSSCRFRKYHGAFDGFGVWFGLACAVSGALNEAPRAAIRSSRKTVAQTASTTTSDGQTITSSSARSVGRASARPRTSSSSFWRFASSICRWPAIRPASAVQYQPSSSPPLSSSRHVVVDARSSLIVRHPTYSGPEMPPSLRMRQKWTAIRKAATSGRKMTCSV